MHKQTQSCETQVLYVQRKIRIMCPTCKVEHISGYWLSGLRIGGKHFIVGKVMKTKCCGATIRAFRPYESDHDAEFRANLIAKKIAADDLSEVCLISVKSFDLSRWRGTQ